MAKFTNYSRRAAKLSPTQVWEIRSKYLGTEGFSPQSQGSLAREYGISVGQIGRIVRGEAWQGLSTPVNEARIEHESIQALSTREEPSDEDVQRSLDRLAQLGMPRPEVGGDGFSSSKCPHGLPILEFCLPCVQANLDRGEGSGGGLDKLEAAISAERNSGDKLLEDLSNGEAKDV